MPTGLEGLVLGGLDLNDDVSYTIEELDLGNAPKRLEWATGADADGALLVRDPLSDLRTITVRIRVVPQSTQTAALDKIAAVSKKLEEAEAQADGLDLVWTPVTTSTKALTFYVLTGEIAPLPIAPVGGDAGYFVRAPVFTMKLSCKPFGYEPEVLYATSTTSSGILPTLVVSGVPGDVPAEGRLVVTDLATKDRQHVEWGLQSRSYDAATSLEVESVNMVTTGFLGVGATRTGAYNPTAAANNVIRTTIGDSSTNVFTLCGTGNLGHVGTFRVRLRAYCTSQAVRVRMAWREGDGTYSRNAYAKAATIGWNDLDLGLVSIPAKQAGAQRWAGVLEAFSTTAGDIVDVDVLLLIPASEGYGKARARVDQMAPSGYIAQDSFNQAGGAIATQALRYGGTWAGAGAATDFTVNGTTHILERAAVSDASTSLASGRIITASGTTTLTNTQVSVLMPGAGNAAVSSVLRGVVARYVNTSNYLLAYQVFVAGNTSRTVCVKCVAGVETILGMGTEAPLDSYSLYMSVTSGGAWFVSRLQGPSDFVVDSYSGSDPDLATGGALATGACGLYDRNTSTTAYVRMFDDFAVYSPAFDAVVFSGQAAEFRSDGAIRKDATGVYYGRVQTYRGARFLVPPAGDQNRSSRIAVKARRNDVDLSPDDQIQDSTKLEVYYRARHAVVRTT